MMRGYRFLKNKKCLYKISEIKRDLTIQQLNIDKRRFSEHFFFAGIGNAEIVVRQYLLLRLAGLNLNKALLLASGQHDGKVVFPLPPQWMDTIEKHGFKVNRFLCSLFWRLYIFGAYCYGVFRIFNILGTGILSFCKKHEPITICAYFNGLSNDNISKVSTIGNNFDIISWYIQWSGKSSDIMAVQHDQVHSECYYQNNIKVYPVREPFPSFSNLGNFGDFGAWAFYALGISIIDWFRFNWWHILLLNQSAMAAVANVTHEGVLAKEYLFHNSNWIYRPLWTYEVEARGSTILFYFYSTNSEGFSYKSRHAPLGYGWKSMTWPRYLVWDSYQARFVQRAVSFNSSVEVVGPIWFNDGGGEPPQLPKRTVAVFDVQPVRDSFYQLLALDFDYYTPRTMNRFLWDIHDVLSDLDCIMVLKRKRELGNLVHPKYRWTIQQLVGLESCVEIDPSISAHKVVKNCDAVISIPFTSTALIGQSMNKPSIYYDPLRSLGKHSPAAHGITIIQEKVDLRHWLIKTLK